ncbi:hypothetical protein RFI_25572 [Reticulomyxa filosa]|uniref:Uncharacterized protein n=1 Tax=Reticulomyxa filosa TaxID=46433 RepID=X6MD36_RETFI|nr:hypothetical protein RFI_25572 [Reticulomyxa filosa]|eukprot:ETO11804.1 hypothetical protein RFI_25572 [Reticulomyxa filosa]
MMEEVKDVSSAIIEINKITPKILAISSTKKHWNYGREVAISRQYFNVIQEMKGKSTAKVTLQTLNKNHFLIQKKKSHETIFIIFYKVFKIFTSFFKKQKKLLCHIKRKKVIRMDLSKSIKKELYVIKVNEKEDDEVCCIKFISLKNKINNNRNNYGLHLCYDIILFDLFFVEKKIVV